MLGNLPFYNISILFPHCALSISNWPLLTVKCKLGPSYSPNEHILQLARARSGRPAGSRAGYELWEGINKIVLINEELGVFILVRGVRGGVGSHL